MESRLIRISSRDRISGTTTDFRVNLRNVSYCQNVQRVVVKDVELGNFFYNISEYNNVIHFKTNNGDISNLFSLPLGNYSFELFKTAFTSKFNSVGVAITDFITDPITGVLHFTTDVPIDIDITAGNMYETLGLTSNRTNITSFIGDEPLNMNSLSSVYIHCKEIAQTNLISSNGQTQPILDVIPLNSLSPYSFINHHGSDGVEMDDITYSKPRSINDISIQIKDSRDRILNNNGKHIVIILKLYF
jgi:hypothetical protein